MCSFVTGFPTCALPIAEWQAIALADLLQRDRYPVFVSSVDATRLDDIAQQTLRAAPEDLARLGFAVAHALDASSPAVNGLDARTAELAKSIADALAKASASAIDRKSTRLNSSH